VSEYTKGPWHIDAFNNIWSEDTDICKMSLININEHADGYRDKSAEEHVANAHLIAASPELLHALKYVRRYLNEEDHDVGFIDAIINKAEGKS